MLKLVLNIQISYAMVVKNMELLECVTTAFDASIMIYVHYVTMLINMNYHIHFKDLTLHQRKGKGYL